MTEPLPYYINEEFFREALDKTLATKVQIKDLQVTRNQAGGNYCSDIYRATVKYVDLEGKPGKAEKVEELKLLVKDLFESCAENSREYFMYVTVLPEINKILETCGIDKPVSPKLYFARKVRGETHIFEDLNARGYDICDRFLGYNEAEAKKVLEKLGRFHAATIIYKDKHPEVVAGMKDFFCKSDSGFMSLIQGLINDNTEHVVKIVETWPGYKEIAIKMRQNTGENFKRKFLSILDKEDAQVRVLAHGDLWIKNILVLENTPGLVEDAIFLDYQNCFDGSPALDINNFFITSVQLELLKTKRLELVEHYHEALCATLRGWEYFPQKRIPTLQSILDELRRTEYFTYYGLLFAHPQTNLSEDLAQKMDIAGFFDPVRMARNREDMFSNARVLETYKHELKRLNQLGVLD